MSNKLKKELKELGIINANGTEDETLLRDAINAVKEVNIDFSEIKKERDRILKRRR